jgi:hypothetical protein
MLTMEKLNTYKKFDGDIDGWARSSIGDDNSNVTDDDWYLIDELVMELTEVGKGFASPNFALEVERKLLASTADEATREALRALVNQ